MNEDIKASRASISRRRALGLGGSIGLGGLLAACGDDGATDSASSARTGTGTATAQPSATTAADVLALLDQAGTCTLAQEATQGPYWFDVDSIRSDLREDRPGTAFTLALRVQDISECSSGGEAAPVANSVVEIWHCDAGGVYSGFESGSTGGGGGAPPSGPPPSGAAGAPNRAGGEAPGSEADSSSGETSEGSYSVGDVEAAVTDDGTYLRGAQVADANGVVQFVTVYPGWYRGRTVHIHLKVHIDKATVLTTQLYFDEALNDEVFATTPYDEHTGRDTTNDNDSIYDRTGLLTVQPQGEGYLGLLNLGVDV
jgi:protocatechuate 3,4-dioxygenase beta subunit